MLKDVQNEKPENEIPLEKVGVEGLRKYVVSRDQAEDYHAIVTVNSYITLPQTFEAYT